MRLTLPRGARPRAGVVLWSVSAVLIVGWLVATPLAPRRAGANPGLPPARKTGAPSENTCNQCHDGPLDDGLGSLAVAVLGAPTSYVPGATYTVVVGVERTGKQCWGFELTCLTDPGGAAAGTFTDTTPVTMVQSSGGKFYPSHTQLKAVDGTFNGTPDAAGWTFNWTAPAAGAGAVKFYAAGVAADGDGAENGDPVYTTTLPLTEDTSTPVSTKTWGQIKRMYQ